LCRNDTFVAIRNTWTEVCKEASIINKFNLEDTSLVKCFPKLCILEGLENRNTINL
jgi:hypothetical protein